jgi:outer membrane receptor protein involved in Fe transport
MSQETLEALPQGTNAPVAKVLLQAPGVTQDSAASGSIHVRNEHANLQYRINGIILPDGVSGFGQVLETGFIGNMALITGALPAEYGLRTSGLVDIQTRSGAFDGGGSIGVYGGSRETLTPSFEYGGTKGQTEYFVTGRYFQSNEGIENPTSSVVPIHDYTEQGGFFSYVSTLLDANTRLSWISGSTINQFQIPNSPNQTPAFQPFGITTFDSSLLNENQFEQNYYDVLALQKKTDNVDWQLAYFARYSDLHFTPDTIGDLAFNGVASNVQRQSFVNGVQGDGSYRFNDVNTLRGGFFVSGEQTQDTNSSLVLPTPPPATCSPDPTIPCQRFEAISKLGWLLGAYVQDEWKITDKLTLNAGLRFDQMYQFVDANQFSPRVTVVYKPFDGTTLHAGYARYFTPPPQIVASPTNVAAFDNTTQASQTCGGQSPVVQPHCGAVLPERSHYFDVGVVQRVLPGFDIGVDGYYKLARDLLDDGQFGAALVLDGFNYAKGRNEGIEVKTTYAAGNFNAYGNIAFANQQATDLVSNQFLFSPADIAYIGDHYIYTDHSQTITASAGLTYLWQATRFSADMIYGSGLRSGDFNLDHVPAYRQVNLGVSHEFNSGLEKPATLRFDIVNLFDEVYEIRSGSGIGVFAPQFGPRREFLVGLSQKF